MLEILTRGTQDRGWDSGPGTNGMEYGPWLIERSTHGARGHE